MISASERWTNLTKISHLYLYRRRRGSQHSDISLNLNISDSLPLPITEIRFDESVGLLISWIFDNLITFQGLFKLITVAAAVNFAVAAAANSEAVAGPIAS